MLLALSSLYRSKIAEGADTVSATATLSVSGTGTLFESADLFSGSAALEDVTGTAADIVARVKRLIPKGWFSFAAPVRDALMGGASDAASWCYGLIGYAKLQTRLAWATGPWLDLYAYDFFQLNIRRSSTQNDAAFRARLQAELLRERVTRAGMMRAIKDLTGTAPTIIEPFNPGDCGAWDNGTFAWDTAGAWGDYLPCQAFIIVTPPGLQGVPQVGGWDTGAAAWDGGATQWVDQSMIAGQVTTQNIYDTINHTKPIGSVAWVRVGNNSSLPPSSNFSTAGNTIVTADSTIVTADSTIVTADSTMVRADRTR